MSAFGGVMVILGWRESGRLVWDEGRVGKGENEDFMRAKKGRNWLICMYHV